MPADRTTDIICDQRIALGGFYAQQNYPAQLSRIRFNDPETGKMLVFLTNQMTLPTMTTCALYKNRWQVEWFSSESRSICGPNVFRDIREYG
jgi:hypothetical protein